MRLTTVMLFAVVCSMVVAATDFVPADERPKAGAGAGAVDEEHYDFDEDYYFEVVDSNPKENLNPDAALKKRLVVEWGKVSMGYMDDEADATVWKDDDSFRPDRLLSFRGRLLVESDDGKSRKPIHWLQGVRVVVSRQPDKRHDWSQRHDDADAAWNCAVIRENGEFQVTVSPGDLHRSVGQGRRFQVGLSLGRKSGWQIAWKNTDAVLPQSVTMLTVPGPPTISKTMQIINGAPCHNQLHFNSAKLVRAVNHLAALGKTDAIQELRQFLKMARDSHHDPLGRVEENIDTSDNTSVFLIVRLLFEPAKPGDELPPILTIPFAPIPPVADRALWPLHPLALQNDVPFLLVVDGAMGGQPQPPGEHVDWAEQHGRIRSTPLRPMDNPMIAAERLHALPQTTRLFSDKFHEYDKDMLYQQAWNILEDACPDLFRSPPVRDDDCTSMPDWDQRLKHARQHTLRWNEREQRYERK